MRWYKHLYVGEAAEKKRFSIIQRIRSGDIPAKAYVILYLANPNNLLDIWEASQICSREWEKRREAEGEELLILGIAWGYQDALGLAGQMVNEVYQATGGFNLREYLS